MKKNNSLSILITLLLLILSSCSEKKSDQVDLVNEIFPETQNELREVINSIVKDSETANLEGLKASHFGSISNFKAEVKDLKIDVFGDIGIATYYPHVSFEKDGEEITGSARQTLVFLKTSEGWKIIHEHGTKRPQ